MAISFVGAAQASGDTVAIPAHQAGDLLLAWCFRTGSNSPPRVPPGWTVLFVSDSTSANNSAGAILAYKIAKSNAETFGTWANGTQSEVAVYRGTDAKNPIIAISAATALASPLSYPALSGVAADSWIVAVGAHRASTEVNTAPDGMVNRLNRGAGATAALAIHDNAGAATSFAGFSIATATASGWRTVVFELRAPQPAAGGGPKTFLVGATAIDVKYVGADKPARYLGTSLEWSGATAAPFDPMTLAPASWWDVADTGTITLLDGRVMRVLDKSGNDRRLYTSQAAKQPLYTASDSRIGGKPSISATRAADVLITQNEVGPTQVAYDVREIYIVAQYAGGTQTTFTVANNIAGWGAGAVQGSNDGYAALIGGNGTNGQPRLLGNLSTAHFITTNALSGGAVYIDRDLDDRGMSPEQPILPLPLSVIRIVVTGTVNAVRMIGNQDATQSRAWSGPWCEALMFANPLSDTARFALVEHLIAKWGVVV